MRTTTEENTITRIQVIQYDLRSIGLSVLESRDSYSIALYRSLRALQANLSALIDLDIQINNGGGVV